MLLHAAAGITVADLKTVITTNAIKINPITLKDMEIAQQVFGPGLATIQGTTT